MFEDLGETAKSKLMYLLHDEAYWDGISDMMPSILHLHLAVHYNKEAGDFSTLNNPTSREKTLTYLYPLLKEGKLVAGRIRRRDPNTPPKSSDEARGIPIFEDIPGSPEEIIEYIRYNWNNNPEFVEQFDCVFKLPEMKWPRCH